MPATKTMFDKAKHKYLRDIISIRTPESAKGSVRELNREFNQSKTKAKRLRIARATQLAANRAKAMISRRLSPRERGEMLMVSAIYRKVAERMFDIYGRMA